MPYLPLHISKIFFLLCYSGGRKIDFGGANVENILCPRCMRMVPSMHGICTYCGENALQCPHCHNINYDKLDAFICAECGHSKYGKIDISLSVRLGFATQKIASEKDKTAMQSALSLALSQAMRSHETITNHRNALDTIIKSSSVRSNENQGSYSDIYDTYMSTCVQEYKRLVKQLKNSNSIKSELLQYARQYPKTNQHSIFEPSKNCYGCAEVYLVVFLKFIELSAFNPLCCEFYLKIDMPSILMNEILPNASPIVTKLLVAALVSLCIHDINFASLIMKQLVDTIELIKPIEYEAKIANIRKNLVLLMELIIRMHSKLTLLLTQKEQIKPIHCTIYTKVNSFLWQTLKNSFPVTKLIMAEEIVQPILSYVNQLLCFSTTRQIVTIIINILI